MWLYSSVDSHRHTCNMNLVGMCAHMCDDNNVVMPAAAYSHTCRVNCMCTHLITTCVQLRAPVAAIHYYVIFGRAGNAAAVYNSCVSMMLCVMSTLAGYAARCATLIANLMCRWMCWFGWRWRVQRDVSMHREMCNSVNRPDREHVLYHRNCGCVCISDWILCVLRYVYMSEYCNACVR